MLGAIAAPVVNQKVALLSDQLANANLDQIHAFGREIGAHASAHTDSILERVRGSDLDVIGAKLGQIVTVAQTMNLSAVADSRSRIPLLGPLIDRMRLKGGELLRRFQDVRTQVDTLIDEVDTMQQGLAERNRTCPRLSGRSW
ncbi:MAG TPA: toxic anion resistance protein [Quisquiliibacterium sp.]|nr:toxic anion resistance protein [Quisquiliibacterium sp.]